MMIEEFKCLDGILVSNFGNVKYENNMLEQYTNKQGYKFIQKGEKRFNVHRVAAKAFISNPNNKPIADHIDSNKTNNNVTNQRYATHGENLYNRYIAKE